MSSWSLNLFTCWIVLADLYMPNQPRLPEMKPTYLLLQMDWKVKVAYTSLDTIMAFWTSVWVDYSPYLLCPRLLFFFSKLQLLFLCEIVFTNYKSYKVSGVDAADATPMPHTTLNEPSTHNFFPLVSSSFTFLVSISLGPFSLLIMNFSFSSSSFNYFRLCPHTYPFIYIQNHMYITS